MSQSMKWSAFGLLLILAAGSAMADVTAQLGSPWTLLPGGTLNDKTWVMPAANQPGGCGSENSNTCEMPGAFFVSYGFKSEGGALILDPDGSISDSIFWDTNGAIAFYSDPNQNSNFPDLPIICVEGDPNAGGPNGCVGSLTLLSNDPSMSEVYITFGSDNESPFDPFGAGYDISDGIHIVALPEPSSALLFGTVLIGAALALKRKLTA